MSAFPLDIVRQFLRVVILSSMPVILTAFLSIPPSLGGHPGAAQAAETAVSGHMT